jgi:hypothetical protein
MKKLYTYFLFLLLVNAATAQTNVSGFINANTTWTLAGSPYIVVGNALLSQGYTLTIDPGVVVKFDSAKALQIDGELHAVGTAADRIVFTSNQTIPDSGDWGKIHLADSCVDAVFDINGNYLSGSIMKYCEVSYAGGLGFGAIHIGESSPYISQCRITYSNASGIYSHESFNIDSCLIQDCNDYAIYFLSSMNYKCDISITNNSFNRNRGGILLSQGLCGNHTILIKNNEFISITVNPVINFLTHTYNTTISENLVQNNSGNSIFSMGQGFHNSKIECNRFINNQVNMALIGVYNNGDSAFIQNNLFDGNSAIWLSPVFYTNGITKMYFRNNIIRNNTSVNGQCCYFYMAALNDNSLYIDHNDFVNNSCPRVLDFKLGNTVESYSLFIDSNNFNNPSSQYEFYNRTSYTWPNIYLTNNYWGSTSTQHADSVIYDYFDDANQSIVYYSPILTSPVQIDVPCTFSTAISEVKTENNHFLIYPNPAGNAFTVSLPDQLSTVNSQLSIYDITGRIVHQQILTSAHQQITNHFSPGIYFVRVMDGERVFTEKLVVE